MPIPRRKAPIYIRPRHLHDSTWSRRSVTLSVRPVGPIVDVAVPVRRDATMFFRKVGDA